MLSRSGLLRLIPVSGTPLLSRLPGWVAPLRAVGSSSCLLIAAACHLSCRPCLPRSGVVSIADIGSGGVISAQYVLSVDNAQAVCVSVSPTGQGVAFGDSGSLLHLWVRDRVHLGTMAVSVSRGQTPTLSRTPFAARLMLHLKRLNYTLGSPTSLCPPQGTQESPECTLYPAYPEPPADDPVIDNANEEELCGPVTWPYAYGDNSQLLSDFDPGSWLRVGLPPHAIDRSLTKASKQARAEVEPRRRSGPALCASAGWSAVGPERFQEG